MKTSFRIIFSSLLLLSTLGCQETIIHDLEEHQANRVKVILEQSGIAAAKKREGSLWNINVSQADATQALAVLDKSRIIKSSFTSNPESSGNLVQSREEREYFLERKLAHTLEQTLERMPHVLEASVHLNLQRTEGIRAVVKKRQETASVLLVSDERDNIDTGSVRSLIAGASGIPAANVSILIEQVTSILPVVELSNTVVESQPSLAVLSHIGRNQFSILICLLILFSIAFVSVRQRKAARKTRIQPNQVVNNQATQVGVT